MIQGIFTGTIERNVYVNEEKSVSDMGKISLTSPIVINLRTRPLLAVETKGLLFLWLAHLPSANNC